MPRAIHAELELTGCSGELWVNGIPLPGLPAPRPSFEISVPVHHLLIPGPNELSLWVDVAGKPTENRAPREVSPSKLAFAVARLVAYEEGVMASPENGTVLARFEYRGADDDSEEAPRVRRRTVDPGVSFGPWAWQTAPVLALDDATRAEAADVVRRVHEALFGGDPARIKDLTGLRWDEMIRAYPGVDAAAAEESHADWIASLAADPRRKIALDPSRYAHRLVAGGRMIECLDEDFFPSIRVGQEVEPGRWAAAPYALSLARIEGRLAVVR